MGCVPPLTTAEAEKLRVETPAWRLTREGANLQRRFDFPDFKTTLAFVNRIGAIAEEEGHHPDISFGWGYCVVELYTHKIKGLHENDFIMAAKIDALMNEFGS